MDRGWRGLVMAGVVGCGGAGGGWSWWRTRGRRWWSWATGEARTVERGALPAGAREGDVVVDGRLDPELRARLAREVAERRARLAVPVPPELELWARQRPPR